jgi:hypothetical protein
MGMSGWWQVMGGVVAKDVLWQGNDPVLGPTAVEVDKVLGSLPVIADFCTRPQGHSETSATL